MCLAGAFVTPNGVLLFTDNQGAVSDNPKPKSQEDVLKSILSTFDVGSKIIQLNTHGALAWGASDAPSKYFIPVEVEKTGHSTDPDTLIEIAGLWGMLATYTEDGLKLYALAEGRYEEIEYETWGLYIQTVPYFWDEIYALIRRHIEESGEHGGELITALRAALREAHELCPIVGNILHAALITGEGYKCIA